MLFYNLNQVFFSSFLQTWQGYVQGKGAALLVSCDLMRRLQHLHEEGVDGRVSDQLEEEQMLQTLEADGSQGGQAEQQLSKPVVERKGKNYFQNPGKSFSSAVKWLKN